MSEIVRRIAASFHAQGLMVTFGAQLEAAIEGEVRIALPFSSGLSQQQGYLHAGATTSILDNACGFAALSMAPAGCEVVTVEFKVNFLRPAIGERFLAIGRVQHSGRTLAVCSGEVLAFADGASKVVALMQATMAHVAA